MTLRRPRTSTPHLHRAAPAAAPAPASAMASRKLAAQSSPLRYRRRRQSRAMRNSDAPRTSPRGQGQVRRGGQVRAERRKDRARRSRPTNGSSASGALIAKAKTRTRPRNSLRFAANTRSARTRCFPAICDRSGVAPLSALAQPRQQQLLDRAPAAPRLSLRASGSHTPAPRRSPPFAPASARPAQERRQRKRKCVNACSIGGKRRTRRDLGAEARAAVCARHRRRTRLPAGSTSRPRCRSAAVARAGSRRRAR